MDAHGESSSSLLVLSGDATAARLKVRSEGAMLALAQLSAGLVAAHRSRALQQQAVGVDCSAYPEIGCRQGSVVTLSSSVAGMTTVRLTVALDATQSNVYAMSGVQRGGLEMPAAYQVAPPFGADLGGTSPAFFPIANNDALGFAEFDSWLSIGVVDGSAPGAISASPGFDLSLWTADAGLSTRDAAIFYMDPASGPARGGGSVVMAQITSTAASGSAGAVLQGRSEGQAEDWSTAVVWSWPESTQEPLPDPEPQQQTVQPQTAAVVGSMAFDVALDAVLADRAAFERDFISALAGAFAAEGIEVDLADVTVTSITGGSVIVEYAVMLDCGADCAAAEAAGAAANDAVLALATAGTITVAAAQSFAPTATTDSAPAPPPHASPVVAAADSAEEDSSTGAVVVVIVLLLLVGAGVLALQQPAMRERLNLNRVPAKSAPGDPSLPTPAPLAPPVVAPARPVELDVVHSPIMDDI